MNAPPASPGMFGVLLPLLLAERSGTGNGDRTACPGVAGRRRRITPALPRPREGRPATRHAAPHVSATGWRGWKTGHLNRVLDGDFDLFGSASSLSR